MYPTPTATRSTPPAAQTQRYQLAGRVVPRECYEAKETARSQGKRVFFVLLASGDETTVPPGVCSNCLGSNYIGLEITTGGPFKTLPAGDNVHRPAWHAKAWWLVARQLYPCPVCGKVREIQL